MDDFDIAMTALAGLFRARCGQEREELRTLIAGGELYGSKVRHLLHGLAGTAGAFGFDEVSTISRKVLIALDDGSVEAADLDHLFAALVDCEAAAT
jgi:HPt (histidine-containing phosphotransfer) domain-containing protein